MSVSCEPNSEKHICEDVSGRKLKRYQVVLIWSLALLFAVTIEGQAKRSTFNEPPKIIVLDPGHGGHDGGSTGINGTYEKKITLNFARVLAAELDDRYKVILTRTDDYWLDITDRTSVANHRKADMFLSIHTGGSFLHQANGMSIYYFEEKSAFPLTNGNELKQVKTSETTPKFWENVQNRHTKAGKTLGRLIKESINKQEHCADIEIQGAPFMVLKGADMPSIMIEIGYLTNPVEEKKLCDTEILSDIAKGITRGINNFFNEQDTISSMDLYE